FSFEVSIRALVPKRSQLISNLDIAKAARRRVFESQRAGQVATKSSFRCSHDEASDCTRAPKFQRNLTRLGINLPDDSANTALFPLCKIVFSFSGDFTRRHHHKSLRPEAPIHFCSVRENAIANRDV